MANYNSRYTGAEIDERLGLAEKLKTMTIDGYERAGVYTDITSQATRHDGAYVYGTSAIQETTGSGWYYLTLPVSHGEKYRIICTNSAYVDGLFLVSSGIIQQKTVPKDTSLSGATAFEVEIEIPNGVDSIYANVYSNRGGTIERIDNGSGFVKTEKQKELDTIVEKMPTVETTFINHREQVVIQGTGTYLFDDFFVDNPEIGAPYSIYVRTIENSPINEVGIEFLDADGKRLRRISKRAQNDLLLTYSAPLGSTRVKFTCYATQSGGLAETPAIYHDVTIFKGYEITTDIPSVTISKVKNETIAKMLPSCTVKTIAHRGKCNRNVTQDSRTAYIESRKMGYTCAENDLQLTSDGAFVMLHEIDMHRHNGYIEDISGKRLYKDTSGNWYWCNTNVSPQKVYTFDYDNEQYIESSVAFSTLTVVTPSSVVVKDTEYKKLKRINIGQPEGNIEQMMTFSEWILLMKRLGMEAYIDIKKTTPSGQPAFTNEQWAELVGIVRRLGMLKHVTWLVSWGEWETLRALDPSARFGLTATLTEAQIEMLSTYTEGGEVIYYGETTELTQQIADKVRECGLVLECWYVESVSTPEEEKIAQINKGIDLGVEAIALDFVRVEDLFING